ncbi:MAG: serine/threonine protein phosphatase PrpC [Oleiphilaceae bacterium]|jgi:serine/threonine protein phosphatase PrpC
MHLESQLELSVGQATETGLKSQNEDCIGMRIPNQPALTLKGVVSVIADGVSAAEAGKEASETCVRNFISDYYSAPEAWSVKTAAQKILLALNRWLVGQSQVKGHISTMSVLIIKSQQAYIFHVGDTRIYRLRGKNFEQLTHDHSTHVNKDTVYLSRAMGMDSRLEVDFSQLDVEVSDIFFLSTDGIHDYLSDKTIQATLTGSSSDFEKTSHTLIKMALDAGSADNLSCQIIRVDKLPDPNNQDIYIKLSDLPFPPYLKAGQKLDGFEVIKELHASSRSQVYLVADGSGKRVIMKTPSVNFEDDPAYIERFVLEQWVGKRIDSPYVVKIVEPSKPKSALYTLVEYVPGITLEQWIKENPKPDINEVVRIAELLGRGLRAFHRKDILHQDIKPDNIMLDTQGIPRIIDFGSCWAAGIEEIDTPFDREDALGTAVYSAPETRFSSNKTKKSDMFSLAVVIYEMLTGKFPYGDQLEKLNDERNLYRLSYLSAHKFNPMVPLWMDGALEKALSPKVDQRQSAFSEFIFELQKPNKKYFAKQDIPLIKSNPLKFWQLLAALEAVLILGLLKWFLG